MAEQVQCDTHGQSGITFVCSHLAEHNSAGLGFICIEPDDEDPHAEAWCNDCDVICRAHNGWTEETEKLVSFRLLCSGCFEMVRIRNTQTDVTLNDLANLRWKCASCDEWHRGPCLDVSFGTPIYWNSDFDPGPERNLLSPDNLPNSFLDDDLCIIDGEHFFVRGIIELPIIGTAETFAWGVWGSLSETNFKKLLARFDDEDRDELEPMFSWLSNNIDEYEDTVDLKMYAHIREPDLRPTFELEPTDHVLSREYHHGITAERVKTIMFHQLNAVE